MAAGGPLKELCDETTCPICLEYFKDPVIIGCGHIFCQACITQCCGQSDTDTCCPQCRETIQAKNVKPNRQLANVVELVKKLQEGKRAEEKSGICARHQEPLKLFCKDDEAPICVVCDKAKDHRNHEEVIQDQLPSLEKVREKFTEQTVAEKQRGQECLTKVQDERQKSLSAFDQMQKLLEEKKSFWLALLDDLEKKTKKRQEENVTRLSEEILSLSNLITEMERKSLQPASEFLQDISSILSRCKEAQGKQLVDFSPNLEETLRIYTEKNSAVEKAVEKCAESLEEALHKVNVTLDPDTAHPELILSQDLKSVENRGGYQQQPGNPERFDVGPCILGREKFTSGRHEWEVNVEGALSQWAVGVARESVKRKGNKSLTPNEGFWAVQVKSIPDFYGSMRSWELLALTFPRPTKLSLGSKLRRICVSLDYEEGCVAFSNVDTGKLLFHFSSASFSGERICPFFLVYSGSRLKC
ncbi:zinc finger protein RFP-like isoform X2 [Hemicordylus capensis]|uniref:zinc finger protein RFP-like isoform X2 n=1 Tax=Hemicordylus capensis TaxID=884348 RepID=UPI00230326C6|nr:zinc finger protein RFP-like isoform X2 [Hemicordylus capensis]